MWALVILPTEPFDSFSIYEQIADNIHTVCLRLFDMSSSPSNYELIPTAAIIVIGDEILSGRTKDKNIGWLADQLSAMGVQLAEARVIADKKSLIINADDFGYCEERD